MTTGMGAAARLVGRDAVRPAARAVCHDALAGAGALLLVGERSRRLGDETERARKTVTAHIRDALRRTEAAHPALGEHLRANVSTGTACSYTPDGPVSWQM